MQTVYEAAGGRNGLLGLENYFVSTPVTDEMHGDTPDLGGAQLMATLALLCESLFLVAVIISQLLRPDLSPARSFLSEYALGDFAVFVTIGFGLMGVGILLLAVALFR